MFTTPPPLTSINSHFFFVLFLIRIRKRTKKNRAVRHGAGFSVNHLMGEKWDWVACDPLRCTNTTVLDGLTRKNPPLHNPSHER